MSEAFKCDACGDYCDGNSAIITLHPAKITEKSFRYDLCPFCFNKVIKVLSNKTDYEDLD